MDLFLVASEILWETIHVLDFGQGPKEPYRIMELVAARSREQARYLAWQTDKNFDGDCKEMPNFRTRKLASDVYMSGVVSGRYGCERYWKDKKALELLHSI
jgi:hypothetical protein